MKTTARTNNPEVTNAPLKLLLGSPSMVNSGSQNPISILLLIMYREQIGYCRVSKSQGILKIFRMSWKAHGNLNFCGKT